MRLHPTPDQTQSISQIDSLAAESGLPTYTALLAAITAVLEVDRGQRGQLVLSASDEASLRRSLGSLGVGPKGGIAIGMVSGSGMAASLGSFLRTAAK